MSINIGKTNLQQTIQDQSNFLAEQWYPCSRGFTMKEFFLMKQNGPFLRPLCQIWRSLGSPKLEVVERVRNVYPFSGEGQLVSEGLVILANSQEKMVRKLIQENLQYKQDQTTRIVRTFEAFASQLNLFSMVNSELIQIDRERCGEKCLHFNKIFQAVWNSQLELFDQGRKSCSKQALHSCIRYLVWGESCAVPLEMLKYSFHTYLIQENVIFETLRNHELSYFSNENKKSTSQEPRNTQLKSFEFENSIKRRNACVTFYNNSNESVLHSQMQEYSIRLVTSEEVNRPSSPEAMIDDIDEDGEMGIMENSPIKWRTGLWTLTLTTPHRTYSIEISPKGTTALSRTDGMIFPLQPMQTLSEDVSSLQSNKCNTMGKEAPNT